MVCVVVVVVVGRAGIGGGIGDETLIVGRWGVVVEAVEAFVLLVVIVVVVGVGEWAVIKGMCPSTPSPTITPAPMGRLRCELRLNNSSLYRRRMRSQISLVRVVEWSERRKECKMN